jgi:excisionase family DNA binding protein
MDAKALDEDTNSDPVHSGSDLLSVPEAAKLLRVSPSTVWRWIDRGIVPAYRVGPKRVFIKREDVGAVPEQRSSPEPIRRKMTKAEQTRTLDALEHLKRLRDELTAARGGEPAPSSVELIREMREERTQHLESMLELGRKRAIDRHR